MKIGGIAEEEFYHPWVLSGSLQFSYHVAPVLCTSVFIFQLLMSRKRWLIFRCYVPPGSAADNYHIAKALFHCPGGLEPILVGDLNVNLSQPEGRESKTYLAVIMVVEEI